MMFMPDIPMLQVKMSGNEKKLPDALYNIGEKRYEK